MIRTCLMPKCLRLLHRYNNNQQVHRQSTECPLECWLQTGEGGEMILNLCMVLNLNTVTLGCASIVDMRFYGNYKNPILRTQFKHQSLSSSWYGTGNNFIVGNNTLYYQFNNPFSMVKLNITTMKYEHRNGLWVTYATEESKGKMVIAQIHEPSFGIEELLEASVCKPSVSNAFMVCEVFYAVRTVDIHYEDIFYTYDTKTKQESYMSVPFEWFQDKYVNLDCNPLNRNLTCTTMATMSTITSGLTHRPL
ncbi:unnamed protein product [Coregonus sp. 'balchen']|nr:unnamed protein product [Coregonus sp. 'balchen']